MKRLSAEFKIVTNAAYDVEFIDDNPYRWNVALIGPENTPYVDGAFMLEILFPQNYPIGTPEVFFKTVIYHPNVNLNGEVCLSILKSNWRMSNTVLDILNNLTDLLIHPNPLDPLNATIANQYIRDFRSFTEKAKDVTRKYAM
jgi:ubiquitin-protein ligase